MTLRDLLAGPTVKRAIAAGEERAGKLLVQLLANERVMHGAQAALSSALAARAALERGARAAAQAVNLPTTGDVEELRRKLAELEQLIDGLAERVGPPAGGADDGGTGGGEGDHGGGDAA